MKIKDSVSWSKVGKSIFITHREGKQRFFHELNSTASFIWEGIGSDLSFEEIFENLSKEYEVDKLTFKVDFERTVKEIQELNLLESE